MKNFLMVFLCAGVLSSLQANTATFQLGNCFSCPVSTPGGTTPWLTANLTDASSGGVDLTMKADQLLAGEFVGSGGWFFNLNPSLNPSSLTFTSTGGQAATAINTGVNAFKADGTGGYFDIKFMFADSGANRLENSDPFSIYHISGASVNDFLYTNVNISSGRTPVTTPGIYYSAAHVQGVNNGLTSTWIAADSITSPAPPPAAGVPEPSTYSLLGIAGGVLLSLKYRRSAKS